MKARDVVRIAAVSTAALLLSQGLAGRARAQDEDDEQGEDDEEGEPAPPPPPPRHFGGQRNVGFGGTLGFTTGAGAALDVASGPLALWLTGGYFPVLVFGNEKSGVDPISRTPNGARMLPESGRWPSERSTRMSSSATRFA